MTDDNFHSLTLVLKQPDHIAMSRAIDCIAAFAPAGFENPRILSKHKAIDMMFRERERETTQRKIFNTFKNNNIHADICIQPFEKRRKKLLICDMDSTLIGQECINELADFAGVGKRVADITERAMRGKLDFECALTERVSLLRGLPLSKLQECFENRICLNKGAKTLARTMTKHGSKTVIVSGGFTFFTKKIADLAGFDLYQANQLLDDGRTLTGEVQMPILGRSAKREALLRHSAILGGPEMALAIGDGANDLDMISAAGLGLAYRAKPRVVAEAHAAIAHTDLTTALYFQGYKESEFA